jgi:hypothetical protein
MPVDHPVSLPTTTRLIKATALSIAVAGALLVTTVLPAEYGIDPTGVGAALGLDALTVNAEAHAAASAPASAAAAATPVSADVLARNAVEASKAAAAFGASDQQQFAAEAVAWPSLVGAVAKHEALSVTLAPGKGAEVKALMKSGDGLVFHWTADGEVAVDMHGERIGVKGAWTSYAVEAAQRAAAGTFTAPFDGSHGWYWQNRGGTPVTVRIEVTGFQEALYLP